MAPTDIKVEWRFAGHDDLMTIEGIDGASAKRATPYAAVYIYSCQVEGTARTAPIDRHLPHFVSFFIQGDQVAISNLHFS